MYLHYIVKEMRVLLMLSLCGVISSVLSEFFHEPSSTELKPSGYDGDTSSFGFSIAYQDGDQARLVVGAPLHDFVGKVYSCPLTNISMTKNISCTIIDMNSLQLENKTKEARKKLNPDQNFYFGASIAATKDYFVTCAPLMTKIFKTRFETFCDFFGACFLHNRTKNEYTEWMDNFVKISNKKFNSSIKTYSSRFAMIRSGALGWNTLVDDTPNGHLLVAKSAYIGDILSVNTNNPLEISNSLVQHHYVNNEKIMNDYYNTGYGMATGYFFNKFEKCYAISARRFSLEGRIIFMKETNGNLDLPLTFEKTIKEEHIIREDLGSMFGYALAAADINKDGLSELIVGAPTYYLLSEEQYLQETGALHIYIGGAELLSLSDDRRMLTILGDVEDGRFGSAITTNDIDNDNIPEIFVSALYANSGEGVVYVISGYDLQKLFRGPEKFKNIEISKLTLTQRILARAADSAGLFGFSLQIVKDIDKNGCNELAIGIPSKNSVRLFQCLPTVTASMTLEVVGGLPVKYDAELFKVTVCLNVTISKKCNSLVGNITVTSNSTGKTNITTPKFVYELTTSLSQQHCENVTVNIEDPRPDQNFMFSTNLQLSKRGDENDYKPWAVLSAGSDLDKKLEVSQRCINKDCEPDVFLSLDWNGDKFIDTTTSKNETLLIKVHNNGQSANDVYVRLKVHGARISQSTDFFWENERKEYICNLKLMKPNSIYTLQVLLNTAEPINIPSLDIAAQLGNKFFKNIAYNTTYMSKKYLLNTSLVTINGSKNDLIITDEDLKNGEILTFSNDHEYYIINDGPVTWRDVLAILEINKKPFIKNVKIVPTEICQEQNPSPDQSIYTFHCNLTLKPREVRKIIAEFEISKKSIETDIVHKNLSMTSKIILKLEPIPDAKHEKKLSTPIRYQEVLTMKNNKSLIIIIVVVVAILLLLLLIFVLYKYGFFKRTEKKKLDVLRESVRKRSIRQASESSRSRKPSSADGNTCDIEVVDDCVFQEIDIATAPSSSKDNVMLIKDTQQVNVPLK